MRMLALLHDAYGSIGGIAKFNRDLLAALASHPACREIVVLPRRMPFAPEAPPPGVTFDAGAIGSDAAYLGRCLRWLATGGHFDVVIAGHINLLPFAWGWRLRGQRPVVLTMHGTDGWAPPERRIARALAPRADAYIAVSGLTRDRFIAWSGVEPGRFHILPNAVDLARFSPGPKSPELQRRYGLTGRRVILTLGRLDPLERAKGFDEILEALPALAASDPDVIYLIAGDGADRARLAAKARTLNVQDRVVFTGLVPENEKPDHYRLADVYAMPSRAEGFGIAFLEALGCGLPVIGSRLDGGREALLDGRLGVLVDPDDRPALLAALRRALAQTHRQVPPELARFSDDMFRARARHIIDRVRAWPRIPEPA